MDAAAASLVLPSLALPSLALPSLALPLALPLVLALPVPLSGDLAVAPGGGQLALALVPGGPIPAVELARLEVELDSVALVPAQRAVAPLMCTLSASVICTQYVNTCVLLEIVILI